MPSPLENAPMYVVPEEGSWNIVLDWGMMNFGWTKRYKAVDKALICNTDKRHTLGSVAQRGIAHDCHHTSQRWHLLLIFLQWDTPHAHTRHLMFADPMHCDAYRA